MTLRGYQERTFVLGKANGLHIETKDEKGNIFTLEGVSDIKIVFINIKNESKIEPTVFGDNISATKGEIDFNFTLPSFDKKDDFFKTPLEDAYGRGDLFYAYAVYINKYGFEYCLLRGLARLVKTA